ncbi:type II toxin-antitoxin system RelE/ParE family toxin [Bizionia myxarmorum]|uniref:Toxin n=1 Tax=Bizionia myxarmorum TaxID=291186 RepID=A0A5D0REA1_9FLAO|nr:type II toxin-antitoxin system RelE/ParE family toxin [Bizionia myxarmorum]TYB79329.1 type II toxin-antitoxin system RelE/ParE family toxin [Bizionia myxarmorum]
MSSKITHYELSNTADLDIDSIFDYTEKEYGFNQAVEYLFNLEAVFNSLVSNPEIGRKRNEIKDGLISIVEQQQVIFYYVIGNYIHVVRVLHGSRDLPKYF